MTMGAPSNGFFAPICSDFDWTCHFFAATGARIPPEFAENTGDISVGNSKGEVGASLHKLTFGLDSSVSLTSGTCRAGPRALCCARRLVFRTNAMSRWDF